MDTKYEEGIRCLKKCWKEHGHIITEDEKAAMKAFRGVFISGKSEPYSHKLALKWLSDNQLAWGDEKYQRHRKIIYELNDAVTNGTIREDYSYLPTIYDTLPPDLKDHLILYRDELFSRLQYRSSRDQLIHCVSFAAFLKDNGILRAQDISTELIAEYHAYADTEIPISACIRFGSFCSSLLNMVL